MEIHIKGECKCCKKITKIVNADITPRADKTRFIYTDEIDNGWDIFRCKACKKVIADRWSEL